MRMWEAGDPIEGGNDTGIPDVEYFDYLKGRSYDEENRSSGASNRDFDVPKRIHLSDDDLMKMANESFRLGDYMKAIEYCDQIIKWNMSNYDALALKGKCLAKLGKNKEACDIYYYIADRNTWGDGDKELAIEYYKKALKFDSTNEKILDNLAYSLKMIGRYSEALTYYKRVTQENVDWDMAMCYMGMKKYAEAIPLLDNVIRESPFRDDYLDQKCECLIELGRKGEAVVLYKNFVDFLMDEECYEWALKRIDLLSKIIPNDPFIEGRREKSLKNKELLEIRFKSILKVMSNYSMYNPNGLDENDLYGFIKFVCEESGESVDDIVRWYRTPMFGSLYFKALCYDILHYTHWEKIEKMYDEGKFKDL
ncbi:tetratricopeptide repeat protein [Methanobrevibacter sp.]|uniref:tetratricopeptide repeat protein n=1 Tax=Methanobrevibacter sp. TaxID=66852 RepID=UPI00387001FF